MEIQKRGVFFTEGGNSMPASKKFEILRNTNKSTVEAIEKNARSCTLN